MSADTKYCPKCGSLNAHFGYPEPPDKTGTAPQAVPAAAPASPSQRAVPAGHVSTIAAPPAQDDRPENGSLVPHHEVYRVPAQPAQDDRPVGKGPGPDHEVYRVPAQHDRPGDAGPGPEHKIYQVLVEPQMVETPAPPTWSEPGVDDPDVELSPTWREGMVRVPRRRYVPTGRLTSAPDPNTAFRLEMFGVIGFLGLGHMYSGRVTRGVLLMVSWWIVFALLIWLAATTLALGLIFVAICAGPALSGNWISKELKRNAQAGPRQ
jgi:hypothetical protein